MGGDHVPPFLVRYVTVLVVVYILEEFMEPPHGDGDLGALKCRVKLILVQLPILVPVY